MSKALFDAFKGLNQKIEQSNYKLARMGWIDPDTNSIVYQAYGRPDNYVFVRPVQGNDTQPYAVENRGVPWTYDAPVRLCVDPITGQDYIKEVDPVAALSFNSGGGVSVESVQKHTHALGSGNEYYSDPRLFLGCLVTITVPASLSVHITPGFYTYNGQSVFFPDNIFDITAYVPASANTHGWVWIAINPLTNTPVATALTPVDVATPLTYFDLSGLSLGSYIPLAAVQLTNSETIIQYEQDFIDMRGFVSGVGGSSSSVLGPGSSTDRALATWNGTTGTALRDNPATKVDSSGNLTANSLVSPASTTLTIASNAVTITQGFHIIEASSGTTDSLKTISGGVSGQFLLIKADADDTITVNHGTGNIFLSSGADFAMSGHKTLLLFYDGTNWSDVSTGTSGALVSPLTTKGDLWGFSTVNARFPVGADNNFVVADSSQALGIKYRTLLNADIPATLSSKTLDNTNTVTLKDNLFTLQDDADTSKQAQFELSAISASTLRTYTLPDVSDTVVTLTATQALTNKTLTSPVINTGVSGTAISTDGTFATQSDTILASQKAIYTYVNAVAQGLSPKSSVKAATTAALPANTYVNGVAGVGATLTGSATGALVVDGYTVGLLDRLLIKDESNQTHNGIYFCSVAGALGVAYVLTRSLDADTSDKLSGAYVLVEETGGTNAGTSWVNGQTSIVFGTTNITFFQFSGAGDITVNLPLTKSGNTISLTTPVGVNYGGTGAATLTAANLIVGNGTSAVTFLAPATAGHYVRDTGSAWANSAILAADLPVFVASGASHAPGAVPDPGSSAGTSRFLREDATWAAISANVSDAMARSWFGI